MDNNQSLEYDVVIMGAGFAGLCQARHLKLNIPNIKIALIDPRSEQQQAKDLKVGESLVEVASLFLFKELGLHEYLIENHVPKIGLNFHWPKSLEKTADIEDYYHIWTNRQPPIVSFQINRVKFERDLLKMNQTAGIAFHKGYVVDVALTPGDAIKTVDVKVGSEKITLKAKHIIDAAGRKFIIGRKTDNLLFGSENLFGLNNGATWMRVKNVDRNIFHDGYDPEGSTGSHYYATNHYFGHGHWLWMIPIDTQAMELSIGIMHHHDVIPAKHINTQDKFLAFLRENHNILYRLIESGEKVDFHYRPQVAHRSKTMFSPDNWYVIGDAACIFDAFYSLGTTMIAFAIESVTEIIQAKLANAADAEQKRSAYNEFNVAYTRSVNILYRDHAKQLGHASIMSWRIYFEYMWWFGVIVPLYVGKWHLDLEFINLFVKNLNSNVDGIFPELYKQFNQLVERGTNIGLLDCYRADQLIWDYYTPKHFDNFLENAKLEPLHCNVFAGLKNTCFYAALWYAMFQWRGFGIQGILNLRHLYQFFRLLALSVQAAVGELIYKSRIKGLPTNSQIEKMRQEFKSYQYRPELRPWISELSSQAEVSSGLESQEVNQVENPELSMLR